MHGATCYLPVGCPESGDNGVVAGTAGETIRDLGLLNECLTDTDEAEILGLPVSLLSHYNRHHGFASTVCVGSL